ncbi:MAG: hypothetical protein OXI18_11640 [bacterium]|nr:hypothetical protein [bacterium]
MNNYQERLAVSRSATSQTDRDRALATGRWNIPAPPAEETAADPAGTIRVSLPPRWVEDALDRHVDIGAVVHRTSRRVTLAMTVQQHAEALSDARHYADPTNRLEECEGVRASARAAVRTLRKETA